MRPLPESRLSDIQLCRNEYVILQSATPIHLIPNLHIRERYALLLFAKGRTLIHRNILSDAVRSKDSDLCSINGLHFADDETLP